ncbi:uncharacterized protein LOC144083074 [Stigmatopora argus]
MRGRYKMLQGKERVYARASTDAHPVFQPREVAGHIADSEHCCEDRNKVYLGVRVKMPVKDLLRNIRLAQGRDPQDLQILRSKNSKGEKKRVKTQTANRTSKRKRPTSSLEELAIIVEVLEEDLRTATTNSSQIKISSSGSPVSPAYSSEPNGTGYNSDVSDEIIPSPSSHTSHSPGTEYSQTPPSLSAMTTIFEPTWTADKWFSNYPLSSSDLFWAQLEKEESKLLAISDEALLGVDQHGQAAFHKVACDGKRILTYAIAKRMAALNSLDLKDSDGMTALLLAAKNNHHLIVEDLIHLGACVSARNNSGKSCLHLSAEKGFIRVLEVLKHFMMDGLYIDVEATDKYGMSVLQSASVALKLTLQHLQMSKSLNHARLHMLRKEQLLETLECLLQMASYSHVMETWGMNA